MELTENGMCFVCGKKNPNGLKAEFEVDRERLALKGHFTPRNIHQGYKGIMHGGLTAALLDEAMVKLLWDSGIPAVSASLRIKLIKPIRIGQEILIKGWVEGFKGRVILTCARIESSSGSVLAEATGKCIRVSGKEERVGQHGVQG